MSAMAFGTKVTPRAVEPAVFGLEMDTKKAAEMAATVSRAETNCLITLSSVNLNIHLSRVTDWSFHEP